MWVSGQIYDVPPEIPRIRHDVLCLNPAQVSSKFMELDASQKTAAAKCKGINAASFPLLKSF